MPSMFGEPVLVRIGENSRHVKDHAPLLTALSALCRGAPVAVALSEGTGGFVNRALLRRAGARGAAGTDRDIAGFSPVSDLPALLRPAALAQEFSPRAVAEVLGRQFDLASAKGCTTVVDRRMGCVAGRHEVEAAAAIFERMRRIRLHGSAHGRLREEWDGKIPKDVPPGRLCIDAASVDLADQASDLASEIPALHSAGWRMAFDARSPEQLETLLPILAGLAPSGHRHRIEAAFVPKQRHRVAIEAMGLMLVIDSPLEAQSHGSDTAGDIACQQLAALTIEAARSRGLDEIAGMIGVGRRADFTVLDGKPENGLPLRPVGTWLDGAPV